MPPPVENTRSLRSGSTSKSEVTLELLMNQLSDFRSYVENQFTSLQSSIDNLTKRMDDMETKQGEYEAALTFCGEEIADIKNMFSEIDSLRRDLDALKKSQKEDNSKVTQLQSEKHLKTLRICGIPKTHNEDLTYAISKLSEQMSCSAIATTDLESIFRPKNLDQSPSSTIIVRFSSMIKRDEFYNGRKMLARNNITAASLGLRNTSKLYINESLSRTSQTLFYNARQRKRELGYLYVWTHHGQIYMRKTKDSEMIKVIDSP